MGLDGGESGHRCMIQGVWENRLKENEKVEMG